MRVLHTADFHAGRMLRGYDRTPEIAQALTEIAEIAEAERVDAVLVSGDLFDTANPSAAAEGALFDFFLKLKEADIPSVSIAGNHDSSARLASVTNLLGWVGAELVAKISNSPTDMVRHIATKSGETLTVGALPYLSERRLLGAADLLGVGLSDEERAKDAVTRWRGKYADGMEKVLRHIAGQFQPGHVNMLMLHATLAGASPSGSERTLQFHTENAYVLTPDNLPRAAQYVALGHIHKAQEACSSPLAHYPGSIIQLDFGEGGEKKQVNLVEVSAGQPARVTPIPLSSGRELRTIRVPLEQVEARLEREREHLEGKLVKVLVQAPKGSATAGLKDRVLNILPALAVELEATQEDLAVAELKREGLSLPELFERYWNEKRGELPQAQRAAFEQALEAARAHTEAEEAV